MRFLLFFVILFHMIGANPVMILSPDTPVEKLYQQVHKADDRTVVILTNQGLTTQAMANVIGIYENKDVWMTLPDIETGISFYAGLFKKIKLEDLFEQLDLHPLIAMAGTHAVKIPGHSLISVVPKKSRYRPIGDIVNPSSSGLKADLVVFSFDRPLQLYACLESMEKYITGLGQISVIYRTSNDNYEVGYQKVKDRFQSVRFFKQGKNPRQDFKQLTLKAAFESSASYLLFAVDDIVVKDVVDLTQTIRLMEKTQAFGFFLRLGKHIDYSYMTDEPQQMPPAWEIESDVFAWQFKQGERDWKYSCSVDMTLYKKSEIESLLRKLDFHNPNLLESAWALKGRKRAIGLCFSESKIVNLPINIVNQSNIWFNRHINSYSPLELLEKFVHGFKMDITPFHRMVNRSPHIEHEISFVPLEDVK